jgi:hypothetical protein
MVQRRPVMLCKTQYANICVVKSYPQLQEYRLFFAQEIAQPCRKLQTAERESNNRLDAGTGWGHLQFCGV